MAFAWLGKRHGVVPIFSLVLLEAFDDFLVVIFFPAGLGGNECMRLRFRRWLGAGVTVVLRRESTCAHGGGRMVFSHAHQGQRTVCRLTIVWGIMLSPSRFGIGREQVGSARICNGHLSPCPADWLVVFSQRLWHIFGVWQRLYLLSKQFWNKSSPLFGDLLGIWEDHDQPSTTNTIEEGLEDLTKNNTENRKRYFFGGALGGFDGFSD